MIPFNKPYISEKSLDYIKSAYNSGKHCGNYDWGSKCIKNMKENYSFKDVFLVPSCTSALEMGALLLGISPCDEVIMPSYTFSSTANSVMQFGAKPIFCEISPFTMNMDPSCLKELINERTKLIMPIDYAGVSCDIEIIKKIAKDHSIPIMVDSAQSLGSKDSNDDWCGSQADLAATSFHETKNISCGEGGALVVNNEKLIDRAYILQEKGTDRKKVIDGIKSKYSWVDKGSSYLLSDLLAAMLYSNLEDSNKIKEHRSKVTELYKNITKKYAKNINVISEFNLARYNHHAFYIVFQSERIRNTFIQYLKEKYNIYAYIGYIPLHSSDMGLKLGYLPNDLPITEEIGKTIVRLPVYPELGMSEEKLEILKIGIDYSLEYSLSIQ